MNKIITPFPAPGIVDLVQLTGEVEGFHYSAKKKLWTKSFSGHNTIDVNLKAIMRDNMNSPTDFAMDNLFSVDGQIWGGVNFYGEAGDPAGKDGIIVYDATNAKSLTIITSVHPTDPSGSYYRQWQGILTNDFGIGSFVLSDNVAAKIGVNLDSVGTFVYEYAENFLSSTTMEANDILTVNWKITVG